MDAMAPDSIPHSVQIAPVIFWYFRLHKILFAL